ncbi:hypothetical protein FRC10_000643 [Ceratobasidium sp. 414]|nr:hypothetical protein FRC10_000643 [Ceratobasidium sp. 414]
MASYGVPFPGGHSGYANPNVGYAPPQAGGFQMGMQHQPIPNNPPAADPYANAQPGTIAYAKSEGPDGIATYTPVIAQETFYQTPSGPTRGIKWVTATSSQASAAGIPSGAITTNNAAQLPQPNGMPPMSVPSMTVAPGSVASGYPPESPADDYPVMRPGMSQREHDKAVKRWEKDRRAADRAAEKRARKEEKERQKAPPPARDRWDRDPQDPYDIAGRPDPAARARRMSAGNGLGGFDRARRMSGGAILRPGDDELSRKLESLDMSFNTRRERRMSGSYAPSAGGYRSRKGSVTEADRPRKNSGSYDLPRPSYYPTAGAPMSGAPGGGYPPIPGGYGAGARSMPGSPVRSHSAFAPSNHYDDVGVPPMRGGPSPHPGPYSRSRHPSPSTGPSQLPGGYGNSYGGARDSNSASAYPYGVERTPYSTTSAPLAGGQADSYALTTTRRPGTAASGAGHAGNFQVSGRELNRAQPFTAFEEFFLVEDLRELLQPQPPPLPAALVPHDVMSEEWDRCMQSLIHLASQAVQSTRSSDLEPLLEVVTQWNTRFFLPRGVDIGVYKGNSRRSGPPGMNMESRLRAYEESESESESSSSSSSSTSSSEEDRYFSSARREQRAARKAERKARHKERARRRRARRRQRSVSIRVRAVPIN